MPKLDCTFGSRKGNEANPLAVSLPLLPPGVASIASTESYAGQMSLLAE
jgi:hypothetical protein